MPTQINRASILPLLLLFVSFFFSCAPLEKQNTLSANKPLQLEQDTALNANTDSTTEAPSPEELTPPEPDQTLTEEVNKLQSLETGEEEAPQAKDSQQENQKEARQKEEVKKVHFDFPVTMNRYVKFYLDFFQNEQKQTFARWLARSGRYLPMIKKQLQEAGLPLDLAYLPMIESGYSLTAYSRARATGPWQFISSTGRHHHLIINNFVDERRDPTKSTEAAISYLSELYSEFGSWELAVAGYNAGEGKIRNAIRRHKTNDFWKLAKSRYLKLETKRYVPKLIAAIMIAKEPEKYGFSDIQYEKPLAYETVDVPRWTTIQAIAVASGVDYETLYNLNRELRQAITPPTSATYPFKVPPGKKMLVTQNLTRVRAIVATRFKDHVVKNGETLTKVCMHYKLNKITLLKANNLRSSSLTPGQHLRIPYQAINYKLLAKNIQTGQPGPATTSSENLVLHTIRRGETLSSIAAHYNVPMRMIATWNNIADPRKIRAGQQLALYLINPLSRPEATTPPVLATLVPKTVKHSYHVAHKKTTDVKNDPSTEKEAIDATPSNTLTYYQVQGGDTLWTIAKKYQTTPQKIRQWNQLKDNVIHPGRKLLLKVSLSEDQDV